MKRALLMAVVAGLVAVIGWRVALALRSDEDRLRRLVAECVEAARERSPKGILAHVDDDEYSDGLHPDKNTLRYTLLQLQLQIKAVRVDVVEGPVIVVADDGLNATVDLRADVFLGTQADQPPSDPMVQNARQGNRYLLHLRKKDGEWRIIRVEV